MVVGAVSGPTDEQTLDTEYRDALFEDADSDGDGQLTQDELSAQVRNGGGTEQQAQSLWQSLSDGSETSITHDEFKGQLATSTSSGQGALGAIAFNIFDADSNGKLTEAEIERLLQKTAHGKDAARQILDQLSAFSPSETGVAT